MLKNILKGMVIGIANIIPGVSGGTMAVAMGIYDKLIYSVTHLLSDMKKSISFIVPIGIGMLLGIVGLSFIIEFLFDKFPIQTNLLFIGLILGGLPAILKKVKGNKLSIPHGIVFVIFFAIVVGFAAVGEVDKAGAALTFSLINCVIMFFVGVIAAATMVIPGVSGSMVLMLLGYYNSIIETINNLVRALVSFDIPAIIQGGLILVPFGIGVVIGIFAIAKLIEIVFDKYPMMAYSGIIGLIVASPFAIVLLNDFSGINFISIITGIITLGLGTVIAYKLGEE